MRRFLSVVGGAVVAIVVMLALESLAHAVAGGRPASVEAMSTPAKLMVLAGYFLGTFAGALAALRLSGWPAAAWIVGVLVLAGGVANLVTIPHPLWMQTATLLLPALAVAAALRLGQRRGLVHNSAGRGVPA
ncbi:hypothetical protein [Sphingomonas lenta]|uniref:Uncharacterized protein n=1 Tax=Sphingomonas lenta TaxID=1141887 RepID=A0A2A2SCA1_9SPHN|nr:hypothetical protein [Sphingomonas lenta]PAX06843.1 hypothetical protein CKY28_12230 [Sphingomonas lenta]